MRHYTLRAIPFFLRVVATFALTVALAACDSSSDQPPVYTVKGSWQGVLNGAPVVALIAPDGRIEIGFADGSGVVGGAVRAVKENVAYADVVSYGAIPATGGELKAGVSATQISGGIDFPLAGHWPLELSRTDAASRSVGQTALQGRWSFDPASVDSDLVVDAAGRFDRNFGGCRWQGSLVRIPSWNLWDIDLTISPAPSCSGEMGTWSGLGLLQGTATGETFRLILSDAAPVGASFKFDLWYATDNQAPLADAGADFSRTVLPSAPPAIALDGSASSDPNGDPLLFDWTVVAKPVGSGAFLSGATTAEPTFVPDRAGDYTFALVVSDGDLVSTADQVTVTIAFAPNRFTDRGDGTVVDNLATPRLVWLKDGNCIPGTYNWQGARDYLQANLPPCGLSDGSAAGDWRLPTRAEFLGLLDRSYVDPALSNTAGDAQWQDGDPFLLSPPGSSTWNSWYFWTGTIQFGSPVQANFNGGSSSLSQGTLNSIWPVRELRCDEGGACP